MNVILRILVGLGIFLILGWIATLLFGIFTGLVNSIAYFIARGTRRIFGIEGTWHFGTSIATAGIGLGKLGVEFCFFIALFLYSFLYPTIGNIAQFFVVATFIAIFAV